MRLAFSSKPWNVVRAENPEPLGHREIYAGWREPLGWVAVRARRETVDHFDHRPPGIGT
jgi:hypothetical protein